MLPGTTARDAPRRQSRARSSGLASIPSRQAARVIDLVAGGMGLAKPIVFVSGFWRSGTTWLQELLAESLHAKTVFEPLCPQNLPWKRQLIARGLLDWSQQETFVPGRAEADERMWSYLDGAFHAVTSSRLLMTCRTGVSESFRRTIVVKDVRLQLNLDTIHDRYGLSVVHLRRHPCAVASSLMSRDWPWGFDKLRMASLVAPFIDDLRGEGLPGLAALSAFDGDTVSRIAAFWAITECLTERRIRSRRWATILSYEDAVQDPAGTVRDLCGLIGRSPARVGNPDIDSVTTYGASRGTPPKLRPHAWRERTPAADVERVHRAVAAIYPEALASLAVA
jgi:hypothetical protein